MFRCKIKILIIIQLTYILYHFKHNWIIKPKQTSLASMALILHSTFERNISLAFQARLIFLPKILCNIRTILAIRSVLALYSDLKRTTQLVCIMLCFQCFTTKHNLKLSFLKYWSITILIFSDWHLAFVLFW